MKKIQYFILTKSIGLYLNLYSYLHKEKAMMMAYRLFSQPRKGKIKPNKLPKTLAKAYKERIPFEGEKIQTYHWKGNEEVILLVHGWESNASRWKKLLPFLQKTGKTIIAVDAPAHGLTTGNEFNAPKYAAYLNEIISQYHPKIIIGHSVGGAATAFFLHRYQSTSVKKVVLLGAPSDFKIISNNFVQLLSLNNRLKNRLEHYYQDKFKIHIDEFKNHEFAKSFNIRALIAHDTEDDVVLVEEGRKYAVAWKNSEYIETKGLGHSLHDPKLYCKIIDFID